MKHCGVVTDRSYSDTGLGMCSEYRKQSNFIIGQHRVPANNRIYSDEVPMADIIEHKNSRTINGKTYSK